MQQSIYHHPANGHLTWAEDFEEGYITHQSFSPPLENDPFCRSPVPTQPALYEDLGMNNSAGYSNHFADNDAIVWTPRSMFSTMPVPPPTLSMPYFPMRLNTDPTPLPFSIEEEDESQSDEEIHSMALMTENGSTASERMFGIHSRLFSPLRRSLSSLSRIYGRHILQREENSSPRRKRLKRALSLKKMSGRVWNKKY